MTGDEGKSLRQSLYVYRSSQTECCQFKGLNKKRLIIRRKKEILSENLFRKSRLLLKFNDYNTIFQQISRQRNHTPNKENKYIGNLSERTGDENK